MALKGVSETLSVMLSCIDTALTESGAPVCVVGTTIGDPAISQCCECAPNTTGELWGSLRRLYPGDRDTGAEVRSRKACMPGYWFAQYQVTLARCFPTLGEDGELPDPVDRSKAADTLHIDAAEIRRALQCCTEPDDLPTVQQITVTTDPAGGCSKLTATVIAPVSMSRAHNQRPRA